MEQQHFFPSEMGDIEVTALRWNNDDDHNSDKILHRFRRRPV